MTNALGTGRLCGNVPLGMGMSELRVCCWPGPDSEPAWLCISGAPGTMWEGEQRLSTLPEATAPVFYLLNRILNPFNGIKSRPTFHSWKRSVETVRYLRGGNGLTR